jgi:hypothetical protein
VTYVAVTKRDVQPGGHAHHPHLPHPHMDRPATPQVAEN